MKKFLVNRWFHTIILSGFLLGAVMVRMQEYNWAEALPNFAFDFYNKTYPRPPTDNVVIVDIDEASMNREDIGQWPWSRLTVARMVDNLKAMGAKAIVFDIVFAEADRTSPHAIIERMPPEEQTDQLKNALAGLPDNDEVLAQAFKNAGNTITGFIWTNNAADTRRPPVLSQKILTTKTAKILEETVEPMIGVATNLPVLAQAAAGNGNFGVSTSIDGIIRKVPLLFRFNDPAKGEGFVLYPSLATEALRVSQGAKTVIKIKALKPEEIGPFDSPLIMSIGQYEIPLDWDGHLSLRFSKARRDKYVPAWTVVDNTVDPEKIRGKIVFVGTSAQGLLDLRSSPLDLFLPGVEMHVNAVEQVLTRDFLKRPQVIQGAELLSIIGAGSLIILLAPFIGVVFMTTFTVVLLGGISFVSWYGYTVYGLLLDPVYPGLCITILFVASALLSYIRTESERQQVRQAFGMYISPALMEELAKNPDKLKLGGETRELTVMFTDIRSFTTISESLTPEALIQLMNGFLTPMTDLVMGNRGTIDKYMGDAMMAFWNAPLDDPDHARHACISALKMNRALDPINEDLFQQGQKAGLLLLMLKAGIGINTGPASVGNMGSKQRFTYSAIGDAVNLASRLEGQTKNYGASILIGPETRSRVPDFATLEMDLIRVKGKLEPVRIYSLIGDPEYAQKPFFAPWRAAHEEMVAAYRTGDFSGAEKLIEKCKNLAEGRLSEFYQMYLQRIADLKSVPLDKEWDGVFVATSK